MFYYVKNRYVVEKYSKVFWKQLWYEYSCFFIVCYQLNVYAAIFMVCNTNCTYLLVRCKRKCVFLWGTDKYQKYQKKNPKKFALYTLLSNTREDNRYSITAILWFLSVFDVVFRYRYWNSAEKSVIMGYLPVSFKNVFYRLSANSSRPCQTLCTVRLTENFYFEIESAFENWIQKHILPFAPHSDNIYAVCFINRT